jgi:hypothetical protein
MRGMMMAVASNQYINPILSAARKEIENSERLCKQLDKADKADKKIKKLEFKIEQLTQQLELAKLWLKMDTPLPIRLKISGIKNK